MESTSSFGNETLTMGMCLCHNNFRLTAYIRVTKIQKILNNFISVSSDVILLIPEWIVLLLGSLGLGMLHGVIPDEHTWPITFSYSVGSADRKSTRLNSSHITISYAVFCLKKKKKIKKLKKINKKIIKNRL